MYRIKDIEGVKPSLRGKGVLIINQNKDNASVLVELTENAGRYKAGKQILSFHEHIEEVVQCNDCRKKIPESLAKNCEGQVEFFCETCFNDWQESEQESRKKMTKFDISFSLNRSIIVQAKDYDEAIDKLKFQLKEEGIDLKNMYTYEEYDVVEEEE
jgi:NAD-dependent SIR2 family protein deacetylase